MKIFITGATGFIGGQVIKRLASTSHLARCLVRSSSKAEKLKAAGSETVSGDISDRNSVVEGMRGCEAVINIAAVYSFWEPDRSIYRRVNVEGTRNVMEAALEIGVSKVVHISTGGIYGKPKNIPFNEESPPGSVRFSEYFETKYAGDQIGWEFCNKYNLPLVVIYPMAVMGPGDPKTTGEYIVDLIEGRVPARIFEKSTLTFVHVRDVAEVIVRALEKENNIGEKYFVGKQHLNFGEINRMIAEIANIKLPRIVLPGFMATFNSYLLTGLANVFKKPPLWNMSIDQIKVMKEGFIADGSKVERELGIEYTPVETAIRETIEAYRSDEKS